MSIDILIVTFARDREWLTMCLPTLQRFATGFRSVVIAAPAEDLSALRCACPGPLAVRWVGYTDVPGNGHMKHQVMKCRADELTDAEFIWHIDADCVLREPTPAGDYFVNGNPVLLVAPWDKVGDAWCWRLPTDRALGFRTPHETMRRHPAVHRRATYAQNRVTVERVTGQPFDAYVLSQRGSGHGYQFSEFNALGNVAVRSGGYHVIDVSRNPWPRSHLVQFWSHSPPGQPQKVWLDGEQLTLTPETYYRKIMQ